jgi:hypothetical protein
LRSGGLRLGWITSYTHRGGLAPAGGQHQCHEGQADEY